MSKELTPAKVALRDAAREYHRAPTRGKIAVTDKLRELKGELSGVPTLLERLRAGLVAFAADPDLAWFAVGARIPAKAEADADDRVALVDDEVRGLRVAAEVGADFVELVALAHDVGRGMRRGRSVGHG